MTADIRQILIPQNDNNAGLSAQFINLPEAFLRAYSRELMAWAGDLQQHGSALEINLWNPPGVTILTNGFQGKVELTCNVLADPATKHVLMVIQPATGEDAERIKKHVEVLPSIMAAHRAKAETDKVQKRAFLSAVFDRIPEYFVERYAMEPAKAEGG